MVHLIPSSTPVRTFEDHEECIHSVVVFPDGCRMVSASYHETLRMYDLKTGVVLKKMEGHRESVWALAVSRDGKMIASGDQRGKIIVWHGGTGESVTQAIEAHSRAITSLDFSPDGTALATGSLDDTTKLWCTKTWQMQGNAIRSFSSGGVRPVRYSPSGELLAIATTDDIEIYNPGTRHFVAYFRGRTRDCAYNFSLAWTLDGTRLLTGASDPSIQQWDTSTWKQASDPWTGHTSAVYAIAIHPAGALIASASGDNTVRLWRFSDRRTIAIFQRSADVMCVTFSTDGKHIISGGHDNKISEWVVPDDALLVDASKSKARDSDSKILAITMTARKACVTGDLSAAEKLLAQEIDADANNYISYANRAFVMARKLDWDGALQDAVKSIGIKPSLIGYISKGIALCGKMQIWDAMKAFDLASVSANGDSKTTHFLLLIKAIALFNANEHEDAVQRVQVLSVDFPDIDPLACRVVEAYFSVLLGTIASDGLHHNEAVDHFTAAVNASAAFSNSAIHLIYEELVVLFGWDLKTLWQIANRQQCLALVRAGRLAAALDSYRSMMDASDEATKASLRAWFSALE